VLRTVLFDLGIVTADIEMFSYARTVASDLSASDGGEPVAHGRTARPVLTSVAPQRWDRVSARVGAESFRTHVRATGARRRGMKPFGVAWPRRDPKTGRVEPVRNVARVISSDIVDPRVRRWCHKRHELDG
jgi:hypothetical protein